MFRDESRMNRAHYRERGYCMSPPLLDERTVTLARAAAVNVIAGHYETGAEPLYRNWKQGGPPPSLVKVDLPHLCDQTIQEVASDPRIGTWVADLLDVSLVQLWACELICKFPQEGVQSSDHGVIGWHQDDHAFPHWAGQICTVWLALVDVDERMGPVRYVEGSHHWGRRGAAQFFFETNLDEQRAKIGAPAGQAWREVTAVMPAGAVSAHDRLTLHASGPNRGDGPRLGLALHLRTENAHLVTTAEPPFHLPDLSDAYACPVLTERPQQGRTREMTRMDPHAEEQLTGGFLTSSVTRTGNTVRRSAGPWSPAVHAWLAHLANAGLDLAPRPVSIDLDTGAEEVAFIAGTVLSGGASPQFLWRDDTLTAVAQLIRRFHDAAAAFTSPPDAAWQQTAAYPSGGDVICHNDLAPWNTVFTDQQPVAFIDWDLAAPGPRWWDVSYALWHFVPLYGDPSSDPFDLADFEPRARRTRLFCDAYGLTERDGLVDRVLERQRAVYTVMQHGAEAGDPAYQRLWDLGAGTGIQRQIDFVRTHRSNLDDALK